MKNKSKPVLSNRLAEVVRRHEGGVHRFRKYSKKITTSAILSINQFKAQSVRCFLSVQNVNINVKGGGVVHVSWSFPTWIVFDSKATRERGERHNAT